MTETGPRDEVDDVVDAWGRERADLDLAPMRVLSRVSRLARHLDRVRSTAFGRHGLESWEFDVLAALRRAGGACQLTPGQLLKQTMVTSGTMTNRIDRLAARGLVQRENHPEDRRGVLVTLTATGRDAVDSALVELVEAERQLVDGLGTTEQDQVADLLRRLLIRYNEPGAPTP